MRCRCSMVTTRFDGATRADYNKATIGHGSALMPLNVWVLSIVGHRAAVLLCVLVLAGCQSVISTPATNGRESGQSIDQTYNNRASVQGYPESVLDASWGPFPNFPPPAKVTWRSKDGVSHEAMVDIGEIFEDQLIRHNVPREDISTEGSLPLPGIILEVNDRTINVYMRATIWTKEPQIPGNRLGNQRKDLIKVYSRTY